MTTIIIPPTNQNQIIFPGDFVSITIEMLLVITKTTSKMNVVLSIVRNVFK